MLDNYTFRQIYESVKEFHTRFNLDQTLAQGLEALKNEVDEVQEAIDAKDLLNLEEELADVLYTVISLYFIAKTPYSKILNTIYLVCTKNNRKTFETHEVVDGIVVRRNNQREINSSENE